MIGATVLFVREYLTGREQLERDTIATARALMRVVDAELLKAQAAAQTLSTAGALARHDLELFQRRARKILEMTKVGDIVVLSDSTGQQLVNTLRDFGDPLPQHGNVSVFAKVMSSGQPAISDIYIGGILHQPVMSVDVPVMVNGTVTYVLSVGLRPERFNQILIAQGLPQGWVAGIFDSTGTLAGRIPSPEKFVGQKGTAEFVARIKETPEGSMNSVSREGIPTLSSWSRSPVTGWSVGIGIPRAELESKLMRTLYVLAAGIAVLLVAGLGLAWMAGRKIAGSVRALIGPAISLGSGQPAVMPRLGIAETVEVASALCDAAELLKTRTDALENANRSLLRREQELRDAHRLARFGDWHWNRVTDEVKVSESVREIFGRDVTKFQEQRGTLVPVESWELLNTAMAEAVRTGNCTELEYQVICGDGSIIWVSSVCEPIRDASGVVVELLGTVRDITKRKQAELALEANQRAYQQNLETQVAMRTAELVAVNRELERQTRKDALTGLQNRIAANERLRLEFLRMKRTGSIYTVLFLDIDHFKTINDTHGHETGDRVLKHLAEVLQGAIRETDLIARFGGEEFLAVLSDTNLDGGLTIAEKIRRDVAEEAFPVIGHLTVSIGVSAAQAEDIDEDAVVRRADELLYQAKAAGRNMVCHCQVPGAYN